MASNPNLPALRREFRKLGIKLSRKKKVGGVHVDIVFEGQQVALIIDPCSNGCGCPEHYDTASSEADIDNSPWGPTPTRCMARMERESHRLAEMGWNLIRIWEHDLDRSVDFVVDLVLEELGVEKN